MRRQRNTIRLHSAPAPAFAGVSRTFGHMRYDWILFDADHTLFDFDRTSREALMWTFRAHGIPYREEYWTIYDGINKACWAAFEAGSIDRDTMRTMRFARFFEQIGVTQVSLEAFAVQYIQALPSRPYCIPGARELLEQLYGKVRLGIITNGLTEVQRPRLESTGIAALCQVIVVSGEINLMKPQHAFFDHTHTLMGRPDKKAVLVVGDSLTADIAGGRDYGFQTCWYNPGQVLHDTGIRPDFEIADLTDVARLAGLIPHPG